MKMKEYRTGSLPFWIETAIEELERRYTEELKKESAFYNKLLEECNTILMQYPFISKFIERQMVSGTMKLTEEDIIAMSKFLTLENDRRDMESIQAYLLGCHDALEVLKVLKII